MLLRILYVLLDALAWPLPFLSVPIYNSWLLVAEESMISNESQNTQRFQTKSALKIVLLTSFTHETIGRPLTRSCQIYYLK